MSTTTKTTKPQAAIDLGVFDRQEAAYYLGMSTGAFNVIAKQITSTTIGGIKYYDKKDLLAYLANIQRISRNSTQSVEN